MELGSIFSINEYQKGYELATANGYTIQEVEPREEWQEKEIEIIDDEGNIEIKREKELVKVRYFQIVEIPKPTEEKIKQARIAELKQKLADTDYIVAKMAEAETEEEKSALREEYAEHLANRKAWRAEINRLENNVDNIL